MLLTPLHTSDLIVHITNATETDKNFLRQVLAIFCDPKMARIRYLLMHGEYALHPNPENGDCHYTDLRADLLPTSAEVINFTARFTDDEWDQLKTHIGLKSALRRDISEAEDIAKEILGYLPKAVTIDVVNG